MTGRALLFVALAACATTTAAPTRTEEPPAAPVAADCRANDRETCVRDPRCMLFRSSGGGGHHTDVVHESCVDCLDWVKLTGRGGPELCARRASGDH